MNMGRSWRESWVCGEGRVDRAGPTTSREDESCRRALPGRSPCEMPVAGNVTGRGPEVEWETVTPCEDILLSHPKD
jgi:hypothetical protein